MVDKTVLSKKYFHLLIFLILLIGGWLRLYRYTSFPVGGETRDEYAWTMLGASLLQTARPISWSYFESYTPFRELTFGANTYPIVTPALDHPPIFSLLPGLAHTVAGSSWDTFGSLKVIRLPLIFLAIFNLLLLHFLLLKLTQDKMKHFLGLLFYATVPMWVFGSRLVVAENLMTTWFLLSSIFIIEPIRREDTFWMKIKVFIQKFSKKIHQNTQQNYLLIIFVCAVAIMTKISGVALPFAVLIYGILTKKKMLIYTGVIGGILGVGLFILYGVVNDLTLFWSVLTEQSGRDIGLATLQNRFFLHPTVVSRILVDGWLIAGLVSVFAVSHNKFPELLFSKVVVVAQLLFILTSVGEQTFHGWYVYGLFPFFAIFLSWWIVDILHKKDFLQFWLIWIFLLPIFRLLQTHVPIDFHPLIIRVMVGVGGVPLLLHFLFSKTKLAEQSILVLVFSLLIGNVIAIHTFDAQQYWEDDEYFLPKMVVK